MAELKLGIAFAGGGVRGAGHLGIVQALYENRIYPTIYAGTSAGSVVASLLAYGYEPKEALAKFVEVSKEMIDIAYGHIAKGILTTSKIEGFVKGDTLEELLHSMFNGANLGDIKVPLGIVATDIDKGKQVIFTNKFSNFKLGAINDDNFSINWFNEIFDYKLSEIIRASSSMPPIFVPKVINNVKLVDGGITNNLPSDVAVALGADKVLSLDLGYSGEVETNGIIDIAHMSVNILMERVTDGNRKDFGLYLNPRIYDVTALDTTRMTECYQRGYEYGLSQINNIVKYLEEV
jgi:NTE family protein